MNKLINDWVYGGFLAGLLLLSLAPLIGADVSPAETSVYLLLPIYMLHQFEEHAGDRFRRSINSLFGYEALTPLAVFIINVPGVWGVIAASLLLERFASPGWALMAVYLVLVNGIVHLVHGLHMRAYNPGLATGAALFLPAGAYALSQVVAAGGISLTAHLDGLASALAAHSGIIVYAISRRPRA